MHAKEVCWGATKLDNAVNELFARGQTNLRLRNAASLTWEANGEPSWGAITRRDKGKPPIEIGTFLKTPRFDSRAGHLAARGGGTL